MADDIERGFYKRGRTEEVMDDIKRLDPNVKITNTNLERLEELCDELRNKKIGETLYNWHPDEMM